MVCASEMVNWANPGRGSIPMAKTNGQTRCFTGTVLLPKKTGGKRKIRYGCCWQAIGRNEKLTCFHYLAYLSVPFAGITMYAVLETGSKQYRVAKGDMLEIERLDVEAGKPVTFDRVLLVNNEGKLTLGLPTVANASVVADVVAHK